MTTKIYNTDEIDLADFLEEVEGRNPVYIYGYDIYVLVSDVEVDTDDVETLVANFISEEEDETDGDDE